MQGTILDTRYTQINRIHLSRHQLSKVKAHKMQWCIKQRLNEPTSFSGKFGNSFTKHILSFLPLHMILFEVISLKYFGS